MKRLIYGNWKMNGLRGQLDEATRLSKMLTSADLDKAEVMICPPATLIAEFARELPEALRIGGQDCHTAESGANTGDISAEMLKDAGATAVIVGHSERRADHGEDNALVKAKAEAAHRAGLDVIVCVGESLEQRDAGQAIEVVSQQTKDSLPSTDGTVVLAYEPIWAIGTGRTPSNDDIAAMHDALREVVGEKIPLLYGGSVKPGNAGEILAVENVNGALVGGASLKADDFYGIISA